MKKILFGSIIRDGASYLPRYFEQLRNLTSDYEIGLAICEGDSTDNTVSVLIDLMEKYSFPVYPYQYSHNGPKFGSVDVSQRWFNIAKTWNYMLDNCNKLQEYDYFCYMEADLIWNKHTIDLLVEGLKQFDCVAPMSMLNQIFYDTWGHRAKGLNFSNYYPYHPDFDKFDRYMPIESAGSCILMKSEVIKTCRLNLKDAMIGHDIIKNGYSFMLDKSAFVKHP